jgi:hypothetical protein
MNILQIVELSITIMCAVVNLLSIIEYSIDYYFDIAKPLEDENGKIKLRRNPMIVILLTLVTLIWLDCLLMSTKHI